MDKKWAGLPPGLCDICGEPILDVFIDGKTVQGAWAIMCVPCHGRFGLGLGTGKGQKYLKATSEKIEG
jgi:hypothetical protein